MGYTLNFSAVWRNFDHLLEGLGLSLVLAVVSILIGCIVGLGAFGYELAVQAAAPPPAAR